MLGAYYKFSAPVYRDETRLVPFPVNSDGLHIVSADYAGNFPFIHLDPRISCRVQLYNSANELLEEQQIDPTVEAHYGSFSVVV